MGARHRAEVERIFQKQFTDLHKKALAEIDTGHITAHHRPHDA